VEAESVGMTLINDILILNTRGLLEIIVLVFLCYIPVLCYLDIRYRQIDHKIWILLFLIGTPITAYLYTSQMYPVISLIISLIMAAIFYFAYLHNYLQGADFMYLFWITMFWVVNPFPVPHGLMQIIFYLYLMIVMILTAPVILVYNYLKGHRWGLVDMMSSFQGGIPFIIPISVAFVLSVMFG
jgi:Flp pilus assembly protein protease CpaA